MRHLSSLVVFGCILMASVMAQAQIGGNLLTPAYTPLPTFTPTITPTPTSATTSIQHVSNTEGLIPSSHSDSEQPKQLIFTPIPVQKSAPHVENTVQIMSGGTDVLQIYSNTTNGSTTFTDSSASNHNITPYGNTQHSTTTFNTSTSSIKFDSNGDYLHIADHANWNFGSQDFTVQFWVNFASLSGEQWIIGRYQEDGLHGMAVRWNGSSFQVNLGPNWTANMYSPSINPNTWYQITLLGDGGIVRFYVGLNQIGIDWPISYNVNTTSGSWPLNIGRQPNWQSFLNGYLDDFVIKVGEAVPPNSSPTNTPLPATDTPTYTNTPTYTPTPTLPPGGTNVTFQQGDTNGYSGSKMAYFCDGDEDIHYGGLSTNEICDPFSSNDVYNTNLIIFDNLNLSLSGPTTINVQMEITVTAVYDTGGMRLVEIHNRNINSLNTLGDPPASGLYYPTWSHAGFNDVAWTNVGAGSNLSTTSTADRTVLSTLQISGTGKYTFTGQVTMNSGENKLVFGLFTDLTGLRANVAFETYSVQADRPKLSLTYGVPTSTPTPYIDNSTKLLLHFDENMTDSSVSGHPLVSYGNAAAVTSDKRFGSGSLYLDGNSDYLKIIHATDFDVAANTDFTVEMWYKIDGSTITSNDSNFVRLYMGTNNKNKLYLYPNGLGAHFAGLTSDVIGTTSPTGNQTANGLWHHIAYSRYGGMVRLYLDGESKVNGNGNSTEAQGLDEIWIGSFETSSQFFKGWIDEFRFSNGVARYTGSTYTVPTEAFGGGGSNPTNTPTNTPAAPTPTYTFTYTPLPTNTPTPIPTATPTPCNTGSNIFNVCNFPDPYFRIMIEKYMRLDLGIPEPTTLTFTVADAAALDGNPEPPDNNQENVTWDFDEVTGVGDGDITDLTGIEFFTGLTSIRTNSSFTIILN